MKKLPDLPPTNEEFWDGEKHEIDTNKSVVYVEKGHRWVQQGPYLVCKSCSLTHSVYIGNDKRLTYEDGKPVVKKIKRGH